MVSERLGFILLTPSVSLLLKESTNQVMAHVLVRILPPVVMKVHLKVVIMVITKVILARMTRHAVVVIIVVMVLKMVMVIYLTAMKPFTRRDMTKGMTFLTPSMFVALTAPSRGCTGGQVHTDFRNRCKEPGPNLHFRTLQECMSV